MRNKTFQDLLIQLLDGEHCSEAILCTRAGSVVGTSRLEFSSPHSVASISASLSTAVAKLSFLLGEVEVDFVLQRGLQRTIALSAMPGDMVLVSVHPSDEQESVIRGIGDGLVDRLLALNPRHRHGAGSISEELLAEAHEVLDGIFSRAA